MTREEELNKYNAQHYDEYDDECEVEFTFERDDFKEWCERATSNRGKKRTLRGADTVMERVQHFFNEYDVLSKNNFQIWKSAMMDNDLAPTTINNRITSLKTYINFLESKYNAPNLQRFSQKILRTLPIQKKQFIENVISRADYDFLISEARKDLRHPNVYLGCKIMGTTGLRKSELYQVKVEHVKHGYADVIGKGAKQRRVYFPKSAREEIMEYLGELGVDGGYVMRRWQTRADSEYPDTYTATTRDGGNVKAIKAFDRKIQHEFSNAGERYGIAAELMHPHGFRHFFAKEFLKNRLDISLLADLLGHSSIEITRIYLKMTSREQADVVDEVVTW